MVVFKKSSNLIFLVLLAFAVFVSSCARTKKLVEQGRYDEAIELATKKLSGKKRKKVKHVKALEEAFAKATQQDMQRIAKLEDRPGSEVRIVNVYRNIRKRQESIVPLLPLLSVKGYQAEFQFVKVDELETSAMKNAAKALYEKVQYQMIDAENGDKLAARGAFHNLDKIESYFRNYMDVNELKSKAYELGMTHILFEMRNNAQVVLPQKFENEVLRMGVDELNSGWNQFHLLESANQTIDLNVIMNITQIDVSPERIKEKEYVDSKEIEDGYDYVFDSNGNVMKDTLGNDIKVTRKVLIQARVFEIFQSKAAIVSGYLEYFDARNDDLIRSTPISVESVFENYASHFRGDRRALSVFSIGRCDTRPLPFPLDEELLLQAAEEMKPIVREEILYSGANLAVMK